MPLPFPNPRLLLTTLLGKIIQSQELANSEDISDFFSQEGDAPYYLATTYDLETVRWRDILATRRELYQGTQQSLKNRRLGASFIVYRYGEVDKNAPVTSVTLDLGVAKRGAQRTQTFWRKYRIKRRDVLVDLEAFWPQSVYQEEELLVRPEALQNLKKNPDEELQRLKYQALIGSLSDKLTYANALIRVGQDIDVSEPWTHDRQFVSKIWGDLPFKYHGIDLIDLIAKLDEEYGPREEYSWRDHFLGPFERFIGSASTSQEVYLGYLPGKDEFIIGWDIWDAFFNEDRDIEREGMKGGWMAVKVEVDSQDNLKFRQKGLGVEEKGFYPRTLKQLETSFPDLIHLRLD